MPDSRTETTVSGKDAFVRVPLVEEHSLPDQSLLLFEQGTGTAFPLNESGARVWAMCDGAHTVDEIVDQLAARYDASRSQIEEDTHAFVSALAGHGLLVRQSPT